jgi:hypothetical protein
VLAGRGADQNPCRVAERREQPAHIVASSRVTVGPSVPDDWLIDPSRISPGCSVANGWWGVRVRGNALLVRETCACRESKSATRKALHGEA